MAFWDGTLDTTAKSSDKYLQINNSGHNDSTINKGDLILDRKKGRPDYQLIYVHDGSCYVTMDGKRTKLTSGDVLIFRPGIPQYVEYYQADGYRTFWVHFTGTACKEILRDCGMSDENIFHVGVSNIAQKLFSRLMVDMKLNLRESDISHVNSLFFEILSVLAKGKRNSVNTGADKVSRAIMLMNYQYAQQKSFRDYARICNLSYGRFVKLFEKATGTTPGSFLKDVRIRHAKELLEQSDMSVAEISEAVGYNDQLYFSKVFKSVIGVSPAKFRKEKRN